MKNDLINRRSHARAIQQGGFTLVELLVAIIIFLILASLAFGAFRAATEGERGPAAAATFRAWVEGARSRAAELGRPVGLRPIIDSTKLSGHIVNEFEYVANIEPLSGTLNSTWSVALPLFDPATPGTTGFQKAGYRVANGLAFIPSEGKWAVFQNPADVPAWSLIDGLDSTGAPDPNEQKLIEPGQRIGIQFNSETILWFSISATDSRATNSGGVFNPSDNTSGSASQSFFIEGLMPGAVWMQDLSTAAPNQSRYVVPQVPGLATPPAVGAAYRIELGEDFLEGERPLRLPRGMHIDLDASQTPGRPSGAGVGYAAATLKFSPTGEVVGDYAGQGAISFYMDTEEALRLYAGGTNNVQTSWDETTHVRNSWPTGTYPFNLVIPSESPGEPQLFTIFPKTGFVQKSPVNPTDGDGDGWADTPFSFRFEGSLDK